MTTDFMIIHGFEDFLNLWKSLNPSDQIDQYEAWTIFFNLDTYLE